MNQFNNLYLMRKVNVHQRGQAMSEALLILGVFFILMLGIQATTSMQLTALQLLLDSGKKVFQINLGSTFSSEHTNNHPFISSASPLFDELKMVQSGLIQARSVRADKTLHSVHISRQSFIEAGTGYASSDHAVQKRIGASASLWLDALNLTAQAIDGIHTLSSKIDSAWKRPVISRDFIQPWVGVVPEQSLLQEHIWRN
jgi:hypothetical protein